MRKAKLPKREMEICQRLRFAREDVLETTQANCAEQIGLDRSTLANYESQRTPLRYDVALRFCRQFIISEEWLATGRHDACRAEALRRGEYGETKEADWARADRDIFLRQCLDLLSDPTALHIKPGTLFSEAYDKTLAPRYAELLSKCYYTPLIVVSDADKPEIGVNFLKVIHERHLILLDHEAFRMGLKQADAWRLYVSRVYECSDLMFRKILQLETGQELKREVLEPLEWLRAVSNDPAWPIAPPLRKVSGPAKESPGASDEKKGLQATSDFRKVTGDMKSALPTLLTKVRKLTEPSGMKAKLAADLEVPQARVSEWLSGKHDPAGETTLQLLKWVELQERQTK